jgi:hypothetical protein
MDLSNFTAEGNRLCDRLDLAQANHLTIVHEAAKAENRYKAKRAQVYAGLKAQGLSDRRAEIMADGDPDVCQLRQDWHDGQGGEQNALEAIRSLRQQISLLQSTMAGHREEMGFAKTGPQRIA